MWSPGIAQGVDTAAVRGALQAGGPVVSVLGGGIDVPYPKENRYLYQDVAAAGVLISEYPPGTEHRGSHFPIRNRIISGLSLGVLAVEAAERSGTLITARLAADQGRDVFAIPGGIDAPLSRGTNLLIQEGAMLVRRPEDILRCYEMLWPAGCAAARLWLERKARPGGGGGCAICPPAHSPNRKRLTRTKNGHIFH